MHRPVLSKSPSRYITIALQSILIRFHSQSHPNLLELTNVLFFSPWVNFAFLQHHINVITQYKCSFLCKASYTQHVLSFIQIVAFIIMYCFILLRSTPFCEYTAFSFAWLCCNFLLMNTWAFSCFGHYVLSFFF